MNNALKYLGGGVILGLAAFGGFVLYHWWEIWKEGGPW